MKVRRFFSFILMVCLLFLSLTALSGCGDAYPEKRSSWKDRQVIAKVGGNQVRFELFKAFYFQYKELVDGGDDSVWSKEDAGTYWKRLKDKIEETITGIYATLDYTEQLGLDPYGDTVDEQVLSYIKANVEGSNFDGETAEGYGSFDAYLEALEELHLTDSVNRLVYRQSVCRSLLVDTFGNGTVSTDEAAVRAFFDSSDCLHLNWVRVEKISYPTEKQEEYIKSEVENAHKSLLDCENYEDIKKVIVRYSPTMGQSDIENGVYLSLNSVSDVYRSIVEEAQRLAEWDVGNVVETSDAFYIPVRLPKDEAVLEDTNCFYTIMELYVSFCIFREIENMANEYSFNYRSSFYKYDAAFGKNIS